MKNLQNVTMEEAQEVLESEDLGSIRDYLDNHSFGWSWEMSEMCEKIIKVQLRLMQEETGEDEKTKNGTYYWEKNGRGDDMLTIVVNERRWSWGKDVLDALERMKEFYPNMSIEAATESERRKLACSYCDYIEEFEVLKQTPEYKALKEAYLSRKKKIIFLDFDGVMDTARYELILRISGRPSVDAYGTIFDPECVWNLWDIIDKTGAKIVVSSSWKDLLTFEELLDMWEKRGLPGEVIGTTPYTLECRNRGDEIDLWLNECKEECKYVILDDIDAGNFNEHQLERLVVVDAVKGLDEVAAERVIRKLNENEL